MLDARVPSRKGKAPPQQRKKVAPELFDNPCMNIHITIHGETKKNTAHSLANSRSL